jgi:hypothetical protein
MHMKLSKLWPSTNGQLVFWLVAVGGVIGGVILTGVLLGTPRVSTPDTVVGAGPLHAHYEQIGTEKIAICNPSDASVSNDGREGVAGVVNIQGPAVVDVTVRGRGVTRHLTQQITKNSPGMTFDIPVTAPADWIKIVARSGGNIGTCRMVPPTYPSGLRSNLLGTVG